MTIRRPIFSALPALLSVSLGCLMAGCAAPGGDDLDADEAPPGVSEDALTSSGCAPVREVKLSLPTKKDIVVRAQACLQYSADGRQVRSRITAKWAPADGVGLAVGQKFEQFLLVAYLGEHVDGDGDPGPGDHVTCDGTKMINDAASGSTACATAWYWRRARPWAAFNRLEYNINGDGKGGTFLSVKYLSGY
jgi:hypothetical protein